MRIIIWNCNMALHDKYKHLLALKAQHAAEWRLLAPRPRSRWQGLKAALEIQRAAGAITHRCAGYGAAGRRFDFVRARERGRWCQGAVGPQPPTGPRSFPQSGSSDCDRQNSPNEKFRTNCSCRL